MSKHFTPSLTRISALWDQEITPCLMDYVRIPNQSPAFDPNWKANGHMDAAMQLLIRWVERQAIKGLEWQLLEAEARTPLLLIEVAGNTDHTVLFYGHMDKQPPMHGWDADLGPWKPVIKNERLYGRGAADDGYALFAALTAIRLVQEQNITHPRCVILIEASEESGSLDLAFYLQQLEGKLATPDLIICLDSGCGDYQRLWGTNSLRGNITGKLSIKVLSEGIHSGFGSGVVPNPFLILQQCLARIEDKHSAKVLIKECDVVIPEEFQLQTQQAAEILKDSLETSYPLLKGVQALKKTTTELLLNRNWYAALSIIGLEGLPSLALAGNVTIPELQIKLSLRTPPTADSEVIAAALKKTLEADPPFQAQIHFKIDHASSGWHAPPLSPWLKTTCDWASQHYFGAPATFLGEGGSIPFIAILGKKFPAAQFLITGVLGPHSNAHGPNEFLDLPTAKKITGCIATLLAES